MHAPPSPDLASAGLIQFNWEDPFDLETQLTEDERMIRDAAHAFSQSELQSRVIEAFREETSAPELFPLMGKAGLLLLLVRRPSWDETRHLRFGM